MNLNNATWTPEEIEESLHIAALVEKSLPPVYRKGISGQKWNIIREWYELIWDADDPDTRQYRFQPTNQQVSLWEEVVLRWLPLVKDGEDKKILWFRAYGFGWTRIAKKLGVTRQTVAARHKKALEELTQKLKCFYAKIS